MEQKQLELSVLSHMLRGERELFSTREKGVNVKSFTVVNEVYEFVCNHLADYGHLPTRETIEGVYGVALPEKTDAGFCTDLLLERELQRHMTGILAEGIQKLGVDGKAGQALEYILANLGKVRRSGKYSFGFTDGDAESRVEALARRRELDRLFGSLFDLPMLKRVPPGILIGVVGRLGVGKSYLLVKLLLAAYAKNKRILLLSPEMTKEEFEMRWDSITSRGTFSAEALLAGAVPQEAYAEWLKKVSERRDWITMDSHYGNPFTVSSINALVSEFNPDILGIDGLPLIGSEVSSGEGWQEVKNVSYSLQSLAVSRKIHVIVTTQASRDAANATVPELHQIAYGDGFAQACSIVLSLGYHKDDDKRYLAVPKNRFGQAVKPVEIVFRPDEGRIV